MGIAENFLGFVMGILRGFVMGEFMGFVMGSFDLTINNGDNLVYFDYEMNIFTIFFYPEFKIKSLFMVIFSIGI